jgi:hypothetical protein
MSFHDKVMKKLDIWQEGNGERYKMMVFTFGIRYIVMLGLSRWTRRAEHSVARRKYMHNFDYKGSWR